MAANQTTITGPKNLPTVAVPLRCIVNSTERMTTVTGTTKLARSGPKTSSPSTADSTEIAGVIVLSPKNSAAPKMPRPVRNAVARTLPAL